MKVKQEREAAELQKKHLEERLQKFEEDAKKAQEGTVATSPFLKSIIKTWSKNLLLHQNQTVHCRLVKQIFGQIFVKSCFYIIIQTWVL